jgi:hypothetical protein
MKELNNRWYDNRNNSWDMDKYSKEDAEVASNGLVNCHSCHDSHYCYDCYDCYDCHDCHGCNNCNNCNYCHYCLFCYYCHYCHNFIVDPRKFTSKNIGSRKDKTYFYWTKEKDQIVCGCFKGTLSEFEERVKEVHGDSEYGKEYQEFIKQCKTLKGI